jgi:hypothetical protein
MEVAVSPKKINIITALYLIGFAVMLRLLPHPANFAPIAAVSIFGGAILPRYVGLWVPLTAMMASDIFLGFHKLIPVTWGCYLLIALASSTWLKKPTLVHGAFLTVSSSVFFFVVTNFAVWVEGGLYAHTWAGLSQCYSMALPFFRNTLLSDMVYTAGLFTVYAFARQLSYKAFGVSKRSQA